MKFSTSTLALALGVVAAPALAGGLAEPVADPVAPAAPVAVAPAAPVSDWTGAYVGAQLGYGQAEASDDSFDEDGAVYGAQVGYNYDFGRFVLGGELDYVGTEIDSDANEIDGVARAKLRAGYDAGAFLPYVTAGYASAYTDEEIGGDDQFDGYVYGAGLDYKVTENIVVGGEVLQHEFEELGNTDVDLDATTAAMRVSYKF
ncbi:outer membrane protein [Limimaricola hongkongensis]|uniref:Outer membrane protein, putative n=1 Tax=Limimaricola hongkongensis DSM 17492 TaxID=1122180 RepID=A0A017HC05_9RHOB|nr:outer membrane beta-barrel protein [Limimaricola hongkongensis]EYD71668.1 outer membrane protein, putative [Limimaricola hongkongensis DSM 17492]